MAGIISNFVGGTAGVRLAGGRTTPLEAVAGDTSCCFRPGAEGPPLRSTGRLGSSSACGAEGPTGAEAAGAEAGAVDVEAGGGPVDVGLDSAGGAFCAGSGDLGFSEPPRLNTGGPSTGSERGFGGAAFFLAAASSSLADCQVPSPSHVLFACKAPDTVNSPWETPVRTASYTVPLSSAMGTGEALYAVAS